MRSRISLIKFQEIYQRIRCIFRLLIMFAITPVSICFYQIISGVIKIHRGGGAQIKLMDFFHVTLTMHQNDIPNELQNSSFIHYMYTVNRTQCNIYEYWFQKSKSFYSKFSMKFLDGAPENLSRPDKQLPGFGTSMPWYIRSYFLDNLRNALSVCGP